MPQSPRQKRSSIPFNFVVLCSSFCLRSSVFGVLSRQSPRDSSHPLLSTAAISLCSLLRTEEVIHRSVSCSPIPLVCCVSRRPKNWLSFFSSDVCLGKFFSLIIPSRVNAWGVHPHVLCLSLVHFSSFLSILSSCDMHVPFIKYTLNRYFLLIN